MPLRVSFILIIMSIGILLSISQRKKFVELNLCKKKLLKFTSTHSCQIFDYLQSQLYKIAYLWNVYSHENSIELHVALKITAQQDTFIIFQNNIIFSAKMFSGYKDYDIWSRYSLTYSTQNDVPCNFMHLRIPSALRINAERVFQLLAL